MVSHDSEAPRVHVLHAQARDDPEHERDWCGKKSANGRSHPAGATGRRGAQRVEVGDEVFGDQGPGYFVRMILPPNSLSNVLTVRCNLDAAPAATAKQQLTIVAVHDSLWTMQYAPPAELPIETKVSPIT